MPLWGDFQPMEGMEIAIKLLTPLAERTGLSSHKIASRTPCRRATPNTYFSGRNSNRALMMKILLPRHYGDRRSSCINGLTLSNMFAAVVRTAVLKSYSVCKFNQNCGCILKYTPRRIAVSAVMVRRPATISLIRLAGTSMSLAKRLEVIP